MTCLKVTVWTEISLHFIFKKVVLNDILMIFSK